MKEIDQMLKGKRGFEIGDRVRLRGTKRIGIIEGKSAIFVDSVCLRYADGSKITELTELLIRLKSKKVKAREWNVIVDKEGIIVEGRGKGEPISCAGKYKIVAVKEVLPNRKPKEGVRVTREDLAEAWDETIGPWYVKNFSTEGNSAWFNKLSNALGLTPPTYCEHSGAKLGA